MNARQENTILRNMILDQCNRNASEKDVYTEVVCVTANGKVIVEGTHDNYYKIRASWNGKSFDWEDWTGTIDGYGAIGEQHSF